MRIVNRAVDFSIDYLLGPFVLVAIVIFLLFLACLPAMIAARANTRDLATRAEMKLHPELTHEEAEALVDTRSHR